MATETVGCETNSSDAAPEMLPQRQTLQKYSSCVMVMIRFPSDIKRNKITTVDNL